MKLFSLKEMEKAINKFSQSLILGSSGYGTIYKGTLTNGRVVADTPEKMVDENEPSGGISSAYSIPNPSSSSFSIEWLRASMTSDR
ncbi:hypothetical protein SUGI_0063720 [Cryptomeria japonica]|nr:hypothetical protein SUGI_0063720 [Cryptomeria japonica]